jgi:hypothetical protein
LGAIPRAGGARRDNQGFNRFISCVRRIQAPPKRGSIAVLTRCGAKHHLKLLSCCRCLKRP